MPHTRGIRALHVRPGMQASASSPTYVLQPGDDVGVDVGATRLVQDLVAHPLVENLVDALHPRRAVLLDCAKDARPALPHRIGVAGDEQQRQGLRDAFSQARVRRMRHERAQRMVGPHGEGLAAQRVLPVGIDHVRVGADPVGFRARALDRLGIRADAQTVHQGAHVALAARPPQSAREHPTRAGQGTRLVARSAKDSRADAERVTGEVHTGDEAPHRMAEHDVGHRGPRIVREAPGDKLPKRMHVGDQDILAWAQGHVAQIGFAGCRRAVADVVVRADGVSRVA